METNKHIVLYDGDCGFCNFWVQWILEKDQKDQFLFAALQSEFGQRFLDKNTLEKKHFDTLYLLKPNGEFLSKSKAVLNIGQTLGGFYSILGIFKILPSHFTDIFYDIISKNRKKIAGEQCMLPTPEERKKFIL